jgi:hypothetical protein
MNISIILGSAFVICLIAFIVIVRKSAKDMYVGKQKLTKEQKAMKSMGAKI